MQSFIDGISHLYLPGINSIEPSIQFGISTWLADGRDYIITANQAQSNDFTVQVYNYPDFLESYAFDINRVSCASLESINSIAQVANQPKSLGWNIIKLYYSAFFSAHSILKILGASISNIGPTSLSMVRSITNSYGFTHLTLNSGLFCIQAGLPNNQIRFYKNPIYDNSHEGLWRRLLDFLNLSKMSVYSVLPLTEAQPIVEKIEELTDALQSWGSHNGQWLSRIRNEVNYAQGYGVWYPYKGYLEEFNKIYDWLGLNLTEPLTIDLKSFRSKPLSYFVRTCQLVNAISNCLLKDLEQRHPQNKSFIKNGISRLQKTYARHQIGIG